MARLKQYAWLGFMGVALALAAPYLLARGTVFNSGPVFNVFGAAAVVAILAASRIHGQARLPWILIAIGQAFFVVGDVLAYNYQRFFGRELPFPSIADLFYLGTYPFLIAGLLLLIRKRTPTQDRASLIDTLTVTTAAGALSWAGLIAPYAHDATLTVGTKLTSIAYPVMDLGVMACVIRFAFGAGRRSKPFYLLIAGAVSLFATDSIYGWLLLHGGYNTGGLLDLGWIVFYVCTGASALHPRMPLLVDATRDTHYRLTYRRLSTLAGACLAAPALLIGQNLLADKLDVTLLAACSAIGFLLVVMRLLDLVKRHELALGRATVLADAGARLVDSQTEFAVVEAGLAAARGIAGPRFDVRFETGEVQPAYEDVLTIAVRGRSEQRGALLISPAGHCDADTQAALQTIATEVAMALDGVAMSQDLLQQRTDARFRSLVQNASDVTLVVDGGGKIGFASPSAERVFGFDSEHLHGRKLLEVVAEPDRTKVAHGVLADGPTGSAHTLEFELETPQGRLEVEATCTNLLADANVGGIVLNVRDVSERKNFERQLAHQAFHDEVTGLANRVLFRDRLDHALRRAERDRTAVTIVFLDLDDFKTVNDTLGHVAGDQFLRIVGGRITEQLREVDTAARLGGDEFAILLEGADTVAAAEMTERVLAALALPAEIDGQELRVSATGGIAEAGENASADELLRHADVAMYAAKEDGKGRYKLFEPEMHAAVLDRMDLKRALQLAVEQQSFELAYQPIVDLSTGRTAFVEALLRWNHLERGPISPADFIPLAEETGLIIAIGSWVLEEAAAEGARLVRLLGDTAPAISVNLSARQLQSDGLLAEVRGILHRTGLPAEKLILEITETAMMEDLDFALSRLQELKAHGIRLAIDDFGSGYSSLNYIRKFPVDILKVDRSFTAGVDTPGEVASLTRTIIELGAILEMIPVAEGIEDEAQLAELRRMDCPLGQGFLFMRPASAPELRAALIRRAGVTGEGSVAVAE